jgi:hypothetical protein
MSKIHSNIKGFLNALIILAGKFQVLCNNNKNGNEISTGFGAIQVWFVRYNPNKNIKTSIGH